MGVLQGSCHPLLIGKLLVHWVDKRSGKLDQNQALARLLASSTSELGVYMYIYIYTPTNKALLSPPTQDLKPQLGTPTTCTHTYPTWEPLPPGCSCLSVSCTTKHDIPWSRARRRGRGWEGENMVSTGDSSQTSFTLDCHLY